MMGYINLQYFTLFYYSIFAYKLKNYTLVFIIIRVFKEIIEMNWISYQI